MNRSARLGWPLALAVSFTAAAMLLPWMLALRWTGGSWAGPHELAAAVSDALVSDWSRGVAAPGDGASALAGPTEFWRWFHVVKALLAAGALIAATLVATRAWTAGSAAATGVRRAAARALSLGAWALSGVALLVLIANVQGAIAPLSSVLSFLPDARRGGDVVAVVTAMRADLAGASRTPATDAIVGDFSVYHVVVAVLAAAVAAVALVVAVRAWRRGRRAVGLLLVVVALAFAVLMAANVSTALAPAPAFDSFLRGLAR